MLDALFGSSSTPAPSAPTAPQEKEKTASVTILVNITDHGNILGQALLDHVTNHRNTKHVSYKKLNFFLNQTETIEIADGDIFCTALEENDQQTVELFSYTLSVQQIRAFLDKMTHDYRIKLENKLGDKVFYFNQHPMNAPFVGYDTKEKDYTKLPPNCVFTMKPFQTNRRFTNLFGPEIQKVRQRVEFFTKNKKWYDAKGIPYTLGLLLSGAPGAGKTSTIKCLANETRRHIININFANDITKTQLENLFFQEMVVVINPATSQTEKYFIPLDQRIYVLEDVDCQNNFVFADRQLTEDVDFTQADKIDLSFLLNLLDGVLEIPGRIVVMTSNFPQRLDKALIRPGRIDVMAEFTKCSHATLIEMMEFFFDVILTDGERDIVKSTEEGTWSPAEMGKLMFEHFGHPAGVLGVLQNFQPMMKIDEFTGNILELGVC